MTRGGRAIDKYVGLEDFTGLGGVEILVGAEGNGGHCAFDPTAIQIDDGTTVTWRWTGDGGTHRVQGVLDSTFESIETDEEGHTFTRTFDLESPDIISGLYSYQRGLHSMNGGRGGIVVGPCCEQYPGPGQEGPGDTN